MSTPFYTYLQPLCFSQKPRGPVRGSSGASYYSKAPSAVPKIKEALNFMRNHSFEVPFIANYRKEYVEPELDVHDLWTIWQSDEKVCPVLTVFETHSTALAPVDSVHVCHNCTCVTEDFPCHSVDATEAAQRSDGAFI